MRIEIYLVETLKPNQKSLQKLKGALIKLFGGLSELPFKGYWKNEIGKICEDKGKIWLIYTDLGKASFNFSLKSICNSIKIITQQKSQAYAINNEMYFI